MYGRVLTWELQLVRQILAVPKLCAAGSQAHIEGLGMSAAKAMMCAAFFVRLCCSRMHVLAFHCRRGAISNGSAASRRHVSVGATP